MKRLGVLERWPNGPLKIAAIAFAVVLAAAVIDLNISAAALPEIDFDSDIPNSSNPLVAEREDIEEAFAIRAYAYAGLLVAITLGLVAVSLRRVAPDKRRALFTDVGVLGVLTGLAALWASSKEPSLIGDGNAESVLPIPPVSMLAVAALGTLATSARIGSPRQESTPMPAFARIALALTALTIALALIGGIGRECGEPRSGGSDQALWMAFLVSFAAGAAGVVSLFQRRWVVALVAIPMPVVGIFSLFIGSCLE